MSFERVVLIALARGRPHSCILVVRSSRELGTGSELERLLVVGIGDIHDVKWVSRSAGLINNAVPASCVLRSQWRLRSFFHRCLCLSSARLMKSSHGRR